MKRVAICTLGCKTNQFESAAMLEQLEAAGYMIVPFVEKSDIYIINSCTVTAKTDSETRRLIRRARRLNPESRIIATGCYAQVAPGELEKMPELDCVLGNEEKQSIVSLMESGHNLISDISSISNSGSLKLTSFAEHTRAFLQIQNGCNSFCSYCIVPYARGRSRSVPPEEIIQEISNLIDNNFKEIVLTGIHLGAYGLDLGNPSNLADLITGINNSMTVPRLRIGSLEPNELTEELLYIMASSKNICHHLHLPLQSGSDSVLKRMGRGYSADFFRNQIDRVRTAMPDAFIGADVIAGFPGETEEEFNDTVKLLNEISISDLHVFPFSSRPGTRAECLPGHLPARIVTERAALLRGIAKRKKEIFLRNSVGLELKVLVQSFNSKALLCKGISRNYITVSFTSQVPLLNEEVTVMITGCNGEFCFGNHKVTT